MVKDSATLFVEWKKVVNWMHSAIFIMFVTTCLGFTMVDDDDTDSCRCFAVIASLPLRFLCTCVSCRGHRFAAGVPSVR